MRTHNEYDPTVPAPPPVPAEVRERMAAGRVFEDDVVIPAVLAAGGTGFVNVVYGDHRADKARRVAETVAAMEAGALVVVGAQLPDDHEGSRTGSPDLLVRVTPEGKYARYLPVDVKNHHTLKPRRRALATVSGFTMPDQRRVVEGFNSATAYRSEDCMQLAHYTRMLQAVDRHPGDDHLVGGVVGTSVFTALTGDQYGVVWYDLTEPTERVWAPETKAGWKQQSVLEKYDGTFAVRVRVAQAARNGETPVVRPYGKAECGRCPFQSWCRNQVGSHDASFALTKGQLNDPEWEFLNNEGLGTVAALAETDLNDKDLVARFTHAAGPMPDAKNRLSEAVRRVRMHRDDVMFERTSPGPVEVPTADVEVDFDVEWSPEDNRVYQWGARVRYDADEATATYEHTVVSFDSLTDETAAALADEFFSWLESFVAEHEAAGRTVKVFHWTKPETSHTARVLGHERSDRLFKHRFVDLNAFMRQHYTAREGFGLKAVAPVFGFSWANGDAGGSMSTVKVEEARHHPDPEVKRAAQAWLMSYNHDDCAAQAAVRDGLRRVADQRVVTNSE